MDDEVREFMQLFERFVRYAMQGTGTDPAQRLRRVVDEHLSRAADQIPVVVETIPTHRWADADLALAELAGTDPGSRLIGVSGGPQRHHFALADMVSEVGPFGDLGVGQVDYRNVPTGPHSERATVAFGLYLFGYDHQPVVVCQRAADPQWGSNEAKYEVMAADAATATALLSDLRSRALANSVLRGQVITFAANEYGSSQEGITFVERPDVAADEVILPRGVLDKIHTHVLGMAAHHDRLLRQAQHLKRGILLYGPPGTGKTHTVRHLIGADLATTVILMSGPALKHIQDAATIARAHQPAIVVLEDCDLIAEDRDFAHGPQPLLFQLLDTMDGLDADTDVVFLLTTNRPAALERALAQRPGRVDLAVEIPLPDEAARLRLLRLYARELHFSDDAVHAAAGALAGTTASFTKELVRRAALRAATEDHDPVDADLTAALADLQADDAALTRALLGGRTDDTPGRPAPRPGVVPR